ncbi:hypothetical protein GX48_08017 [Paracoccidioides brasiliensis]|nr:hypothetical protein GX48_08017 [Paracoccidioides brasiliensis]
MNLKICRSSISIQTPRHRAQNFSGRRFPIPSNLRSESEQIRMTGQSTRSHIRYFESQATDRNQNLDSRIDAGDNHWASLHSLFYDDDSDLSDTSMSIATNKRSPDYEDDEESDTSLTPQGSSSSDSDSCVSSQAKICWITKEVTWGLNLEPRVCVGESKDTSIAIDGGVRDPSDDLGTQCRSDDEFDSDGRTPPMLIKDGGVTTEEWMVDEILKSMLVEDNDQRMRWYSVE